MSEPAHRPQATPAPIAWADSQREAAFHRWLAEVAGEHELLPATLRLASADASFRRYLRIDSVPTPDAEGCVPVSRIIMDAPPEREDCRPFVKVAALMAQAGLNVPHVLAWNEPLGFMLLHDLGNEVMIDA